MFNKNSKGFTFIELLISISIIGILSSVVLIGLGGFRERGQDTRRISDLHQVQNALELYYFKNAAYPPSSDWATLQSNLENAGIGVKKVSNDPLPGENYSYGSDGQGYVLRAKLSSGGGVLNNDNEIDVTTHGVACDDASFYYCIEF
ncbi:prepilin-type N-terminal cleavage/methylation domain-containing protein [Candidatus Wolfebacteria bacterium]|nr:prepilin-type N-terminal cleavage/methylation domain-containing protein [Candidatus Wolfebacteria bacterium]